MDMMMVSHQTRELSEGDPDHALGIRSKSEHMRVRIAGCMSVGTVLANGRSKPKVIDQIGGLDLFPTPDGCVV